MNRVRFHTLAGIAGTLLLAQLQLHGQVNATIFGIVHDSSGAVIPQVTVSAKNTETGVVRTTTTDLTGSYQVLSVPAGSYDVEAAVTGFKTALQKGITVTVGASVPVNF